MTTGPDDARKAERQLAEEIKRLRKAAHLTQLQLAEVLGLSRAHISNVERVKRTVSVALVRSAERAFDTNSLMPLFDAIIDAKARVGQHPWLSRSRARDAETRPPETKYFEILSDGARRMIKVVPVKGYDGQPLSDRYEVVQSSSIHLVLGRYRGVRDQIRSTVAILRDATRYWTFAQNTAPGSYFGEGEVQILEGGTLKRVARFGRAFIHTVAFPTPLGSGDVVTYEYVVSALRTNKLVDNITVVGKPGMLSHDITVRFADEVPISAWHFSRVLGEFDPDVSVPASELPIIHREVTHTFKGPDCRTTHGIHWRWR